MKYIVELVITNKRKLRDPEGETILRDLISPISKEIESVRTGKIFLIVVNANSQKEAIEKVKKIAEETRLFNPIIHEIRVRGVIESEASGSN